MMAHGGVRAQPLGPESSRARARSIRDVAFAYQSGWEPNPNLIYMVTPFAWTIPARHDMSTLKDSRRLYAAEQLVPVLVDDSKLGADQNALAAFGQLEASTFEDTLAGGSDHRRRVGRRAAERGRAGVAWCRQ